MPDTRRCPDCGHANPAGATSCEACNFPLVEPIAPAETGPPPPAPAFDPAIPRPVRRPRRAAPMGNQALSLWLLFGFICAAAVIYIGVKANVDRAQQPVEGSNPNQQQVADQIRAELARDSTNVEAHVALGNVLYDTGNWSDAIIHYKAALARDSSRAGTFVDMGVCYYNLGNAREAERLLEHALRLDPHQAVALFNLAIMNEGRGNDEQALQYYHRALESGPPEEMKQPIIAAMQRILKKTGKSAPPLPQSH
jgi:tetratricopeptide (TPR) repeat protein